MLPRPQPLDPRNRRFNPRLGKFEPIGHDPTKAPPIYPDSFEVLSNSPRIVYYPKFLTDDECDLIMDFGKDKMALSKKRLIRNRFVAHLPQADLLANASIATILRRISKQTKHPVDMFQARRVVCGIGFTFAVLCVFQGCCVVAFVCVCVCPSHDIHVSVSSIAYFLALPCIAHGVPPCTLGWKPFLSRLNTATLTNALRVAADDIANHCCVSSLLPHAC